MLTVQRIDYEFAVIAWIAALVSLGGCGSTRAARTNETSSVKPSCNCFCFDGCPRGFRETWPDKADVIGFSAHDVTREAGARRAAPFSLSCEDNAVCSVEDKRIETELFYEGGLVCVGHDCSESAPGGAEAEMTDEELAKCPLALRFPALLSLRTDRGTIVRTFKVEVIAFSANSVHVRGRAVLSGDLRIIGKTSVGESDRVDLYADFYIESGVPRGSIMVMSFQTYPTQPSGNVTVGNLELKGTWE